MPASGPVYQPTTVSYEQQAEWAPRGGGGYLSLGGLRGGVLLRWGLLALASLCIVAGVALLAADPYTAPHQPQHKDDDGVSSTAKPDTTTDTSTTTTTDVIDGGGGWLLFTAFGVCLLLIGFLLLAISVPLLRHHRSSPICPCFPSKEERLARQLDSQAGNGQILTLNPSTDLLVTAQYGPVSEIGYQPPAASAEQEETHKLMASDNKECEIETTSSLVVEEDGEEEDRELNKIVESIPSGGAPLAAQEEITPSLRTSASSLFYQMSPTPAEGSLLAAGDFHVDVHTL